ncbi:MAG: ATP-binding protein [Deltaproteobacteria bacterium]|nr:ATP-binding protein [Deltaproteobacteria bacterium]
MKTRYIPRTIEKVAKDAFDSYPVITITGPRQSGKTTLVREIFDGLHYVNLEDLETRDFAQTDPIGFLNNLSTGAILDEIQRVPELLSFIQVRVDENQKNGQFVLTGSQHFGLTAAVGQSLAGRTAVLSLLPFSIQELSKKQKVKGPDELLYKGFYPRVHARQLEPHRAMADYLLTYVERDLRQVMQVRQLSAFQLFLKLCAGRVGQIVNLSSLADDVGVSHTTIREWISILETSYILFRLPPFFSNLKKRLVKSPKLYFWDVGLASHLLGIENAGQVQTHPQRGGLFENLVVAECMKYRLHRGKRANLSFFRDHIGHEIDLIYERGLMYILIEIKSAMTVGQYQFRGFKYWPMALQEQAQDRLLIYAGKRQETRSLARVVSFMNLAETLEEIET